ncbi:hypothetical protein V8F33_000670 [Rhypophila sp. PSN 637]
MGDKSDDVGVDCGFTHDPHDHLIHYTKCLEFWERSEYLWSASISTELRRRIESELRRIQFLRKTIEADEDDKFLVGRVVYSHEVWKKDTIFKNNIESVRKWRKDQHKINGRSEPGFAMGDQHEKGTEYDPDIDFNAYTISYHDSEPVDSFEDERFQGSFPNQKINMVELLRKTNENFKNPLTVAGQGQNINYFHLPANNMKWVERAMSRYYDEEDLNYDAIDREPTPDRRTKAYMLLRPQFWKGQEYGSRSAIIHARHMRPICEIVSTNTKRLDSTPNNIVLFCPYLHWDTDRYRDRISQIIGKEEERARIEKETRMEEGLRARREQRKGLPNSVTGKHGIEMLERWPTNLAPKPEKDPDLTSPIRSFSSILQPVFTPYPKIERHFKSKLFRRDPSTGRIEAGHKLGQFLIDAARLYEAMSCFRDKSLIRHYLHADPPLHPRRTLDQAYYCTLKSTKWRDRDQVVYRGTRANPCQLHGIDPKTRKWNCPGRQDMTQSAATQHATRHRREETGPSKEEQEAAELAYKCPECTDHIRKVARLIMVDQLWMWILDEKTLVTCFPRRYGVNRKDPSGVHHLVRKHLKNIRQEHIRTVFDLALIVLIEVTNVFFDRAKTPDHQPQVIDIFVDAIGEITNKQAVAFDHLWVWTSKIVNLASPNPFSDITSFVFPLLNINPEGKLQREIKDIIDELDIMLLINRQQLTVIRKFVKHTEDILDPQGIWRDQKGSMFGTTDDINAGDTQSTTSSKTDKEKAQDALSQKKKKDYLWFKAQSDEVVGDIESHISELESLRASAVSTSSSLDNLLGLMQQQASALQAWQSARQAEETVKQGRAIIMFTTVTIIFLPLSFMTGIFGMNNSDFSDKDNGNTMSFRDQLGYMLPISISIIVLALILAYAARSKPIVAVFWRFLVSSVIIKSGAFNMWLTLTWQRDKWVRRTDRWVRDMKKDVLRRRQKRMELHLQRKQERAVGAASAMASGVEGLRRGSAGGSLMSRIVSGSSFVLRRGETASSGFGRAGVHDLSKAVMSGGNGNVNTGRNAAAASPTGMAEGFELHVLDSGLGSNGRPGTGVGDQSGHNHGGAGPSASAISGLTTLAPTNTTDLPGASRANMRGGNGRNELRFWDRSFGEVV